MSSTRAAAIDFENVSLAFDDNVVLPRRELFRPRIMLSDAKIHFEGNFAALRASLFLWLLGFVSGYTLEAFIHVLLVVALVLLVQIVSGRRVV